VVTFALFPLFGQDVPQIYGCGAGAEKLMTCFQLIVLKLEGVCAIDGLPGD